MAQSQKDRRLSRLRDSMRWSRGKLSKFRENRLNIIREYAGANYSENGARASVPQNQIALAASIYMRTLAARIPQVMVTIPYGDEFRAEKLRLGINHLLKEIEFDATQKRWALESMLGVGIVKVGLTRGTSIEINGFLHDVGQPYADVVDLDDWVQDMNAKRYEQIAYAGHRYKVPLEWAQENKDFSKEAREKLKAYSSLYNEDGDERSESVVISEGSAMGESEYVEMVELWDLWLPMQNAVLTVPADLESEILLDRDWDGPEHGPYHILSFNEVPGNAMPKAPAADWLDLHTEANILLRKLMRQARNQKTILGVPRGQEADGAAIIDSSDGEAVTLNANAAKEYRFRGPDNVNLAFFLSMGQMFSKQAGNIEVLGGLSPQSATVGQDRLLSDTANKIVGEMKDRMVNGVQRVIRDLGWYLWTDPLIEIPVVHRLQNTGIEFTTTFGPEDREGDYYDYNVKIDPFSMTDETPMDKLRDLDSFMMQIAIPLIPLLQQYGITINLDKYLKLRAKYANNPDLEDVLVYQEPSVRQQIGAIGEPPARSGASVSRAAPRPPAAPRGSTQSARGFEETMIQKLLGAGGANNDSD